MLLHLAQYKVLYAVTSAQYQLLYAVTSCPVSSITLCYLLPSIKYYMLLPLAQIKYYPIFSLALHQVLYSVISGPVLSIVLEINQLEKLVRHTGGINVEGGSIGVGYSVELLYVWSGHA